MTKKKIVSKNKLPKVDFKKYLEKAMRECNAKYTECIRLSTTPNLPNQMVDMYLRKTSFYEGQWQSYRFVYDYYLRNTFTFGEE